jgi:DNA-binding response OmpR family regulator
MKERNLRGCRVLIVEDEYFLADDLEKALKARGASIVGPISDFGEAKRQAARDHFDVAVLDINLFGEKVYPIADELIRRAIPFIFCSGYERAVIPAHFAGVSLWQKPVEASEVADNIELLYRSSWSR